jgi:hypothetical protein
MALINAAGQLDEGRGVRLRQRLALADLGLAPAGETTN